MAIQAYYHEIAYNIDITNIIKELDIMFLNELSASDCFDYFVNNFESLYKNESKYKQSTVLDPDIKNIDLYESLCDHYLSLIINHDEFKDLDISFERGLNGIRDFIYATFYDLKRDIYISIEINRNETLESVADSFNRGMRTVTQEYASGVHEIKMSNYS